MRPNRALIRSAGRALLTVLVASPVAPSPAAGQAQWQLAPDLQYDSDGRATLTRPSRAIVAPDGELLLQERGGVELHRFDVRGRYLGVIGRSGEGPGELEGISDFGFIGDSLWVVDASLRRAVFFDRTGRHLTTFPVVRMVRDAAGRWLAPVSMLTGGGVLVAQKFTSDMARSTGMRSFPLLRFSRAGQDLGAIATIAWGADAWLTIPLPGGSRYELPQPWPSSDLHAPAPAHGGVVVVQRPQPEDRARAEYVVTVVAEDGEIRWRRSVPYQPVPLTDEIVRREVERISRPIVEMLPSRQAAEAAVRKELHRPRFLPPARAVLVGADGRIWVQREDTGGDERWDVLTAYGSVAGQVVVPAGVQLLAFSDAHAWGTTLDEYDVPTVRRYRLVRGAR